MAYRLIPLACAGCGTEFLGRPNPAATERYCSHKCQRPPVRRGEANSRFNGGLSFDRGMERWVVVCRDGSLLRYARAVMAAEVGRPLRSDEIVHHVNGRTDDDRSENLAITTRSHHMEIHRRDLEAAKRRVGAA